MQTKLFSAHESSTPQNIGRKAPYLFGEGAGAENLGEGWGQPLSMLWYQAKDDLSVGRRHGRPNCLALSPGDPVRMNQPNPKNSTFITSFRFAQAKLSVVVCCGDLVSPDVTSHGLVAWQNYFSCAGLFYYF